MGSLRPEARTSRQASRCAALASRAMSISAIDGARPPSRRRLDAALFFSFRLFSDRRCAAAGLPRARAAPEASGQLEHEATEQSPSLPSWLGNGANIACFL